MFMGNKIREQSWILFLDFRCFVFKTETEFQQITIDIRSCVVYNKLTRKMVIMAIEITKNPRSFIPRIFIFRAISPC